MFKQLKRISQNSSKFQFVISYQELTLDCCNDWFPSEVSILWSRKRRKIFTKKHPFVGDPLKPDRFTLMWMLPEDVVAKVTLFKDGRKNQFDNKEWTLSIIHEDEVLASCKLNLKEYASIEPRHCLTTIHLKPHITSITSAYMVVTISCCAALPSNSREDSQSMSSSMDSCNIEAVEEENDVAMLSDFVSIPSMDATNISWFTNGMQEFQQSVESESVPINCDVAKMREVSIPSIKYDTQTIEKVSSPGPAESLMEWCLRVTNGYPNVKVSNMTTSFQDGLAFCAIINHHRPDLVNFDGLMPSNYKENNKLAFEAVEKLGMHCPLNMADILSQIIPDKLSILTLLHQLRQYFLHSKTYCSHYHIASSINPPLVSDSSVNKLSNTVTSDQSFNKSYLSRSLSPPSSIASPISSYERKNFLNPFDSDEEELDSRCSTYIDPINAPNYSSLKTETSMNLQLNSNDCNAPMLESRDIESPENIFVPISQDFSSLDQPEKMLNKINDLETNDDLRSSFEETACIFDFDNNESNILSVNVEETPIKPIIANNNMAFFNVNSNGFSINIDKYKQPCKNKSPELLQTCKKYENSNIILTKTSDEFDKVESTVGQLNNMPSLFSLSSSAFKDSKVQQKTNNITHNRTTQLTNIDDINSLDCENKMKNEPTVINTKSSQFLASRQKAKELLASVVQAPSCLTLDEQVRTKELRERARKLISEAKAKNGNKKEVMHIIRSDGKVDRVEVVAAGRNRCLEEGAVKVTTWCIEESTPNDTKPTSEESEELQKSEAGKTLSTPTGSYMVQEMEALEEDQRRLNERAADVEWRLRRLINNKQDTLQEQQLLQEWFTLVNQKNVLVHRRARLEMLAAEQDLERRFQMLSCELHQLMSCSSTGQQDVCHAKEKLLLEELMQVVKERDELVQTLDEEERSFEADAVTDQEIKHKLQTSDKATCRLQ